LLSPACLAASTNARSGGRHCLAERMDGGDSAFRKIRPDSQLCDLHGLDLLWPVGKLPVCLAPPQSIGRDRPHERTSVYHCIFLPVVLWPRGQYCLQISPRHAHRHRHPGLGRAGVLHLEEAFPRMNRIRSAAHSPYMEWAKLHSVAKFNLATSGMMGLPLAELGVSIDELEINGVNPYGYTPLIEAIATRYRVPQECVVTATGTSLANHLALAAATEPGDEILVEQPSYDPILCAAQYLGLKIRRFQRPAERNFDIDLEDLERNLTPLTRLIVMTDMHNPSGALCP